MIEYPKKLLPKKNYKYIDLQNLDRSSILLRTINTIDINEILVDSESEDGKINVDIILPINQYHQVYGLSVNLLGLFTIEDIIFRITNKDLTKDWEENQDEIDIGESDYTVLKDIGCIYFKLFSLHEKTFKYRNPRDNPNQFTATCKILHKPTKANFWHYQIEFEDNENKIMKSKKSEWQKDVTEYLVKSFLTKYAFYSKDAPNIKIIDDSSYIKESLIDLN